MSCVQECTRVTKLAINRDVGVLKIECRLTLKNSIGISMIMLLLYFKKFANIEPHIKGNTLN